jgi:hypothetical protein
MKIYYLLIVLFPTFLNAQIISTFAGNGICGESGNGGPATAAHHPCSNL